MSTVKYVNRVEDVVPEPRDTAPVEISEPPKPLEVPKVIYGRAEDLDVEEVHIWSMNPVAAAAGHVESFEGSPSEEFPKFDPPVNISDLPEDNFGNTATDQSEASASGDFDPKVLLLKALMDRYGSPSDLVQEFERFRTQVIVALKHLGVDVRRFFPER